MRWSSWSGTWAPAHQLTMSLAAACAILGLGTVRAQNIVSRPPSFQAMTEPNAENDIVARIARTGQFQPEDLQNVARLVFLESVAMHVDIRADLAETTAGNFLDPAATNLSNASELFYQSVLSDLGNPENLARSWELLDAMELNRDQVESVLGEVPGFSNPAANRLGRLSRLLDLVNARMRQIDTSRLAVRPLAMDRSEILESLRAKTRLLVDDIAGMIARVNGADQKWSGEQRVRGDLDALLARVKSFAQLLSRQPSDREVESSYQTVREAMWRIEATILKLNRPPTDLASPWRAVRDRFNEISDIFGTPRIINLDALDRTTSRPGSVKAERPMIRVYRGPSEVLSVPVWR